MKYEPKKVKDECTRRNPCPSATLFTTNPTRNKPVAEGERRHAMFHTPTHNSLSTVDVVNTILVKDSVAK